MNDGSEGFDANYAKQLGSGRRAGHFKVPGVGKRQDLLGVHTVGGRQRRSSQSLTRISPCRDADAQYVPPQASRALCMRHPSYRSLAE
jgi:hypothetical protein